MNHGTKIEWTHFPNYKGETWNPITGCSWISEGCDHCYAERISKRFKWPWGKPIMHPERVQQPSHWKKPRAIFVCSMSDLFHPDVPYDFIKYVWLQMDLNPRHLFLILTKRPGRLLEWSVLQSGDKLSLFNRWPDNAWLGVTVENNDNRDRIDILRQVPAAHKFVSFEPLLSAIPDVDLTGISWCIAGGESGKGVARPMKWEWPACLLDDCERAGVPFFMKQMSEYGGKDKHDIPPLLDVKQFPEVKP